MIFFSSWQIFSGPVGCRLLPLLSSKPGIGGLTSPWCSPQPHVTLPHLVTFAPLFFSRCLNISPPLLPHGSHSSTWSLLDRNVLLPPVCPAVTASHIPVHPGPATHPSVSLWVGVSSPPLPPGAAPPFPSGHLRQPWEQGSQERGAVLRVSVGGLQSQRTLGKARVQRGCCREGSVDTLGGPKGRDADGLMIYLKQQLEIQPSWKATLMDQLRSKLEWVCFNQMIFMLIPPSCCIFFHQKRYLSF